MSKESIGTAIKEACLVSKLPEPEKPSFFIEWNKEENRFQMVKE